MRTSPPTNATLLVALILWLIGLLDLLAVMHVPNHLGPWALVAAGGLLIVASQVRGL